ncbi:MAG TPA: VCBS repeat-containing protein, partial [Pirellulales bacterium]
MTIASNLYDGIDQVPFELVPDLAVDTLPTLANGQPNLHYESLYVTWGRYYPAGQFPGMPDSFGGSDIFIATSSDAGVTWTIQTKTDAHGRQITTLEDSLNDGSPPLGFGFNNWARVAVGLNGAVYVGNFTQSYFGVDHSTDGGANFYVPPFEATADGLPFGIGPVQVNSSYSLTPQNNFRTVPSRAIAADPFHPGVVYAAEAIDSEDAAGNIVDRGDIVFSFSTDYGVNWHTPVVINDDNGSRHPTGSINDVAADQVEVRLRVGPDGKIGLVWLDSRNDPANKLLDVFGTVGAFSTDPSGNASVTFSPNFRITDQSFNADLGQFTDATGNSNFYLGDGIGLAMTESAMYVSWTDTRYGNQDIFFSTVSLNPLPPPPNDRFEPNDTAVTATQLGTVVIRHLPRLTLSAGDNDWFQFRSLATGQIDISAQTADGAGIQVDLVDATGSNVLASGVEQRNESGNLIGARLIAAGQAGQSYLIHVHRASTNGTLADLQYSLDLQSLTEDVGTVVDSTIQGTLQVNDEAYYLLSSAAAGSLEAKLVSADGSQSGLHIEVLDPQNPSVILATSGENFTALKLPVTKDQPLLVHLVGGSMALGSYAIELTNRDQYSDSDLNLLHFPAGSFPSQEVIADLNGDGTPDVAIADAGRNTVSVLLANQDGTFQAPRQFAIGASEFPNPEGATFNQGGFRRAIVAADFNGDGIVDLAITNYDSSDVSILLGRGDGTFQPERRFDAAPAAFALAVGDVNNDGHQDLVVADAPLAELGTHLAILLGRGDGGFLPPKKQTSPTSLADASLALVDLDGNGNLDLVVGGGSNNGVEVFRGDGQGGFNFIGRFLGSRQAPEMIASDIDHDGKIDILAASLSAENTIWFLPGNGDGTFRAPQQYFVGQSPIALALVDWGTVVSDDSDLGYHFDQSAPDGLPDLVVANAGTTQGIAPIVGPPEIVVLPNLGFDSEGIFLGFGDPIQLSQAEQPLDVKIADFNGDGTPDIGVVDRSEFFVIYGKPPVLPVNNTQTAARDLGTVVHLVQPTLTITSANTDAWYRLQVPTEASGLAKDEVLDFSGGFVNQEGAGLAMEVVAANGKILGSGERLRLAAHQGQMLYLHVFGKKNVNGIAGAGAYTLIIDSLPQLVSVEAPSLLPGFRNLTGGPTTSLVLAFQGDRLDAGTAQNPSNYIVTWAGADGIFGNKDDRPFTVGEGLSSGTQAAIYDASSNIDVASGLTYPTAIRQTVTLLFGKALPAGSYKVEVKSNVIANNFSLDENSLLTSSTGFNGHPVVSKSARAIKGGAKVFEQNLVQPTLFSGDFSVFEDGTRFLTQFHNDLG